MGIATTVFPYPRAGVHPGIERHALELVRHLTKLGHTVSIFTTFWNGGRDEDTFEGVLIRRAEETRHVFGRLGAFLNLHYLTWGKALEQFGENLTRCDILHALAPLSSSRTLTARGLPLLTHFHHYQTVARPVEYLHKPIHHRLEAYAFHHSTLVAALSIHSASQLKHHFGIADSRIRVIPDGVDPGRFSPGPERSSGVPVILCVGPHEPRKGYAYLLHAVKRLNERGTTCRVIMAGRGEETGRLKAVAQNLGIANRVSFPGYLSPIGDDLPSLYRQADLFVHPSLDEGFGMVLAEAMAAGVPIVASKAGAIPEVVGNAGTLVPPRDSEALANAMERVLSDPGLAKALARRGRVRVESLFSWERVAQKTTEVYQEAIELAHGRSARLSGNGRV